jgi:hypothetical protein
LRLCDAGLLIIQLKNEYSYIEGCWDDCVGSVVDEESQSSRVMRTHDLADGSTGRSEQATAEALV